jgi:hypothetical protein
VSSNGAYRDFPSYYYKQGNLFGAYLLGHTAKPSWDVRTETERLGNFRIPDAPSRHRRRAVRPAKAPARMPKSELGEYVRRYVSEAGALRVLNALQTAKGEPLTRGEDPYLVLDLYILRRLAPAEQRTVLERLKAAALEESRTRKKNVRKPRPAQKADLRPKPAAEPRPRKIVVASTCAMCGAALSEEERALSVKRHATFLGQAYCGTHAEQVASLLGVKGEH